MFNNITDILPILQMSNLSLRMVQWCQSHNGNKRESQIWNFVFLVPDPTVLPHHSGLSSDAGVVRAICPRPWHQLSSFCSHLSWRNKTLNLGFASNCTFIPTEGQKYVLGYYSLKIPQVSTLILRDKHKMHDCLNTFQVILNTSQGIWQTKTLCSVHFQGSLSLISTLLFTYTWLLLWFSSIPCLQI
jgi:hypothetical protein